MTIERDIPIYSDELTKFERLLLKNIHIQGIDYQDANDVGPEIRLTSKKEYRNDPEYNQGVPVHFKGSEKGNRYNVYVSENNHQIGYVRFQEYLDSPYGYGKDDYFFWKWVIPSYRHTRFARRMIADLLHMLFISGKFNKLYTFMSTHKGKVDFSVPCRGPKYESDGPDRQKFLLYKGIYPLGKHEFTLGEFNRDIYMRMNLRDYKLATQYKTEKEVDNWLDDIYGGAALINEAS